MKLSIIAAAVAVGLASVGVAHASEDLAKASGCATCHAVDAKKMGPSYKSVAAKYKGDAAAEGKLVEKLSKAKGHPAVKASPDDVKKLVKWTLSL